MTSGIVLAILFAVCGFVISSFDTWVDSWELKAGKAAPVTLRLPSHYFRLTLLRNEVHYLATTSSTCPNLVPRGKVLRSGSECTGLATAFETKRRTPSFAHLAGLFTFYFIMGVMLSGFMRYRSMGRARLLRSEITVFALLTSVMVISKIVLLFTALPAVVVPALFLPLIAGHFYRRQVAFVIVICTSLAVISLLNFDIEIFLVFTVSGMGAVLAARGRVGRMWKLLRAGVLSGWTALMCILVTTLIFSGTFSIYDDPAEHLDPRYSLWLLAIINGIVSGVLASALAPSIGRLIGEVSRGRLLDLQDLNQRLLKRIQERAPGTWEHSRAMANLAEAAVNAIGGNALLVRVGAYYHDVGKSSLPEYFIENQGGGENAHDDLPPDESAACIFRHVTEGTRLLRQEGVSEDVIEFCYSHHGTSLLEFFWHKVMAEGNPEELSERDFTYPGHRPTTRETGILMLVDAIEAGARTVDKPDKDTFKSLVQTIVFSKLSQGQLDESSLSLSDLRVVVNTLVDTLVNMYHARIKYPWQTGDTGAVTSSAQDVSSDESADEAKNAEKTDTESSDSEPQDESDSTKKDKEEAEESDGLEAALSLVTPPEGTKRKSLGMESKGVKMAKPVVVKDKSEAKVEAAPSKFKEPKEREESITKKSANKEAESGEKKGVPSVRPSWRMK